LNEKRSATEALLGKIHIRSAEGTDVKLLKELIDEMGVHERLSVIASEESLAVDGFGPRPKFCALIAEVDRSVAGYALFFDCYSSFQGRGIFLEDLFVRDEFQGKGVGNALLSRIASIAIEQSCFGVMFNVLEWNEPALKFFDRAGAALLRERKTLCLTGSPLREIAKKVSAVSNSR
jgi:GNAT superfamily N-acetyltransferase